MFIHQRRKTATFGRVRTRRLISYALEWFLCKFIGRQRRVGYLLHGPTLLTAIRADDSHPLYTGRRYNTTSGEGGRSPIAVCSDRLPTGHASSHVYIYSSIFKDESFGIAALRSHIYRHIQPVIFNGASPPISVQSPSLLSPNSLLLALLLHYPVSF